MHSWQERFAGIFQRGVDARLPGAVRRRTATVLQTALELGNASGALVCTRHGDTEAMPDMEQVREFVRAAG